MGLVDRYYYRGAGRSAMRHYNELSREWRRRTFGRRTGFYAASLLLWGGIALVHYTPGSWHLAEGVFIGMAGATTFLMPQVLLPDAIARFERGAWGEQSTARTLRKLDRRVWRSRHDLATGFNNTNRDHIVAGPAVYLLDSKQLYGKVVIEEDGLHQINIDTGSDTKLSYAKSVQGAARAVSADLSKAVGFRVWVYPVVVIWSQFLAGEYWEGDVAYVAGEQIADWITRRPSDLLAAEKQAAVKAWLKSLPKA